MNAHKIYAYLLHMGYFVDRRPGAVNIIYIEGCDENGVANADRPDEWNDRRVILMFSPVDGSPYIALNAAATTEPGVASTNAPAAQRLGGVARIPFGQWRVWAMGYHQQNQLHPALVQVATLMVHRDANKDGKRTGDKLDFANGINQHGTRPGLLAKKVGAFSAGCLVGHKWEEHLRFIELCRQDPNYKAAPDYLFHSTIINGDHFTTFKY